MKTRLAIVIWWMGALIAAGGILAGVFSAIDDRSAKMLLIGPLLTAMFTLPAWAICYVLTGSFLRPPRI